MRSRSVLGFVYFASLLGCGAAAAGGPLEVHDVQPRGGTASGEQPVRITGRNFRQDIGYTVYFGAARATSVTIMDDTTLLVASPQHDPGHVDLVVAADNGPAFKVVNGFEFQAAGAPAGARPANQRY